MRMPNASAPSCVVHLHLRALIFITLAVIRAAAFAPAQEALPDSARARVFDQILDLYVRDGYVYYRALKSDRAKLDAYLNQIATSRSTRRRATSRSRSG